MSDSAKDTPDAPIEAETGYEAGPDKPIGSTPATTSDKAVGDGAPIVAETGYSAGPDEPVGVEPTPAAPDRD